MSRIDIEDILDRYLNGAASAGEKEQIDAWLDRHHAADSGWQQMDDAHREQWLAALFTEVEESTGINRSKVVAMRPRKLLWRSIAAAAAVILVIFAVYRQKISQNAAGSGRLSVINVAAGQEKHVTLPDGSKIDLNSLSVLKFPKAFDSKTREVYLAGEGYFDIQHDAAKPFIIHTGSIVTTVLGTAFNIKVDNTRHTVVVTVTRGMVSVANGRQQLGVITPNQQISFNMDNQQKIQQTVDAQKAIRWLESDLYFNNVTFADAAAQLQRRFNVRIGFANDKIRNCRFTGSAIKTEKLYNILKVICEFNNASYQKKADGSIVIDGPGCN